MGAVTRKGAPVTGKWAVRGGFVRVGEDPIEQGEDLDDAARRELKEETGLDPDRVYLEQLFTFGKAGRDPRMRVISVAYYALVRPDLAPFVKAGGDVSEVQWFDVATVNTLKLGFDHDEIVEMSLTRIRGKLEYLDATFRSLTSSAGSSSFRKSMSSLIRSSCSRLRED